MFSSARPDVADDLARRTLRVGGSLSSDPSAEVVAAVREHLRELRKFAASVQLDRWYAAPFRHWTASFGELLDLVEYELVHASPARVGHLLEDRVAGSLFEYRVRSYDVAAALSVRRRTPLLVPT